MIAHVQGTLLEKQPTRLVVVVGGAGLEILVPLTTSRTLGDPGSEVSLHTVLVVREDSLTLYGFGSARERSLFLKLIGVSGIGPKIALGALSGPPIEELVAALRNDSEHSNVKAVAATLLGDSKAVNENNRILVLNNFPLS